MPAPEKFILLAQPRTGSTWLGFAIRDTCGLPYAHEFFSLYNHGDFGHSFGHETQPARLATPPHKLPDIDKAWKVFEDAEHRVTKEVFSSCKLSFFAPRAQCVVLWRSPELTFPGNSGYNYLWNEAYYVSAEQNADFLADDLVRLQKRAKELGTDHKTLGVAGYLIAYAQLLRDCEQFNVPVLDYERLCLLPEGKLEQYLEARLPKELYKRPLVERIISTRVGETWLHNRMLASRDHEIPELCRQLTAELDDVPELMRI